MTDPLTEPLRNTYPIELLTEKIKKKLMLTPEAQIERFVEHMQQLSYKKEIEVK